MSQNTFSTQDALVDRVLCTEGIPLELELPVPSSEDWSDIPRREKGPDHDNKRGYEVYGPGEDPTVYRSEVDTTIQPYVTI